MEISKMIRINSGQNATTGKFTQLQLETITANIHKLLQPQIDTKRVQKNTVMFLTFYHNINKSE